MEQGSGLRTYAGTIIAILLGIVGDWYFVAQDFKGAARVVSIIVITVLAVVAAVLLWPAGSPGGSTSAPAPQKAATSFVSGNAPGSVFVNVESRNTDRFIDGDAPNALFYNVRHRARWLTSWLSRVMRWFTRGY